MNALNAAIDEATVELDIQTVEAFEVTPESADEVLVAFKTDAEVHEYGCHFHGQNMAVMLRTTTLIINQVMQNLTI